MRAADLRSVLDEGFAGDSLSQLAGAIGAVEERDRFPSAVVLLQCVSASLAIAWDDAVDLDIAQRLEDTWKPVIQELLGSLSANDPARVMAAMDRLARAFMQSD